jgi:hypothetical protein
MELYVRKDSMYQEKEEKEDEHFEKWIVIL